MSLHRNYQEVSADLIIRFISSSERKNKDVDLKPHLTYLFETTKTLIQSLGVGKEFQKYVTHLYDYIQINNLKGLIKCDDFIAYHRILYVLYNNND